MKRRRRWRAGVRWGLKWVCTAATVLLLGVTGGSFYYSVGWLSSDFRMNASISEGAFSFLFDRFPWGLMSDYPPAQGWSIGPSPSRRWAYGGLAPGTQWLFVPRMNSTPTTRAFSFPVAGLALVTGCIAGGLWLSDRRRLKPGACPACGYDLSGLSAVPCPECGAAPA